LRHTAGPAALAMQKCFVVNAIKADVEEGSLYFFHSKAGFNFSFERPAALACFFMSNSSCDNPECLQVNRNNSNVSDPKIALSV